MNRPPSHDDSLDALLGEVTWLRRLAVALVGEARAEDLAQETVVTALREGPGLRGAPLRGWLRTVMRRLSMGSDRRDRLRRWAEEGAAREEADGGEVEDRASARLRLHRVLNEAIEALPPTYRTVLVLTYLEDLPPREVARRLKISPEAARQRLSRGQKVLRGKLDREYGSRRDWMAGMAALMTMKKFAIGLGVVLVAWVGLKLGSGPGAVEEMASGGGEVVQEMVELEKDPPLEVAALAGEGDGELREAVPSQAPKREELTELPLKVFRGEIVMQDLSGARSAPRDGEVRVGLMKTFSSSGVPGASRTGRTHTMSVKDGQFEIEVAAETEFVDVYVMTWGGDAAFAKYSAVLADLDLSVRQEVPATLAAKIRLSVLDDVTEKHLDRVRLVVAARGGRGNGYPSLNDGGGLLAKEAPSPVIADWGLQYAGAAARALWVGSPGYQWALIQMSTREEHPREVRLQPGGTLAVHLDSKAPAGTTLRLRDLENGRHPIFEMKKTASLGPFVFEGVRPGPLMAALELGPYYKAEPISVRQECVVRAGERGEVWLKVNRPEEIVTVPTSMTLLLPKEYGIAEPRLYVTYRGELAAERRPGGFFSGTLLGTKDTFRFDLGELPVGKYSVVLEPLQYRFTMDVQAESSEPHHRIIPPGVEVLVSFVEKGSLNPVEGMQLTWLSNNVAEWMDAFSFNVVAAPPGSHQIHLVLPTGQTFFDVRSEFYRSSREEVQVSASHHEFEMQLTRVYPLHIKFLESGVPAPLPNGFQVSVEALSGGETVFGGMGKGHRGLDFSGPGVYRISLPGLLGYAPVEPFDVVIEDGPVQEHVVELKKL